MYISCPVVIPRKTCSSYCGTDGGLRRNQVQLFSRVLLREIADYQFDSFFRRFHVESKPDLYFSTTLYVYIDCGRHRWWIEQLCALEDVTGRWILP